MTLQPSPPTSTSRRRAVAMVIGGVVVAVAAFLLSFNSGGGSAAVVPDTASETGTQFSLDMRVSTTADVDPVYLVEQRARPNYRIFRFDPRTGIDETIFTVPAKAIIYGIALSPDEQTLAVAYTEEHAIGGSGLWLLDITSDEFIEVASDDADVYLTEPEFAADGQSVFVTHVDRRGDDEVLNIARVDLVSGSVDIAVPNAITPAVIGDDTLLYLEVDDDNARRSVGILTGGSPRTVDMADSDSDLDHLVATIGDATEADVYVGALEAQDESGVTIGERADAHGNHTVPSTWWALGEWALGESGAEVTDVDPILVYDASATSDGTIVYATLEGLSVATDERIDLIASRAIRFVAG